MRTASSSIERRIAKLELSSARPKAGGDHAWVDWLAMAEIIYISDCCQGNDDLFPPFEGIFRPRAKQRECIVPRPLWVIVSDDLPLLDEEAAWSMDNEIKQIREAVVSRWAQRGLQLDLAQLDINDLTLLADLRAKPANDLGTWASVLYLALPDEVVAAVGKAHLLARRASSMDWTSSNRPLMLSDLNLDVADYPWSERRRYEDVKPQRGLEWTPHWWKVECEGAC